MTLTSQDLNVLGAMLECIFYGAYVVLFILSLALQRRNNRGFGRPLTLAHILLFGLCTLCFCLDISTDYLIDVVPDVKNLDTSNKLDMSSIVVFAVIDYLAQMTLLYRCWIVWGRRWAIVAIPGFLALVTLGGGFAIAALDNSPLWKTDVEGTYRIYRPIGITTNAISLVVNALTTLIIVTKIFVTSREVRPVLGSNSDRSFRIATAILIESGLLTFAFQLVYVVLFSIQHSAVHIISGLISQIYGITPTLLNIRVVMGSTYDKTTEKMLSLRFAHSGGAATRTTGPSMSAAGIQSRDINVEFDGVPNNELERAADDAA
ncbi:hypothetical protein BD779DRAFT_1682552 [Infundibulicybe gibba]|nr:hypothetical protein BD779DRAFT_1682552 [Infundibulicybe gibba]